MSIKQIAGRLIILFTLVGISVFCALPILLKEGVHVAALVILLSWVICAFIVGLLWIGVEWSV